MLRTVLCAAAALAAVALAPPAAQAQTYDLRPAVATQPAPVPPGTSYSEEELVTAGHAFFGQTSGGLAQAIETMTQSLGLPNGYVLGEEASGAIIGGLRYGEGVLTTRAMGRHKVFWQGPSLGWDFGGSGARVMMLVYHLRSPQDIMQRFGGVEGSAYLVGGLAMNVLAADEIVIVPVRTGVGVRLGVNAGYLKFTPQPTWNPF
ncbi:DUF1134 domain-containing protein [Acuticoccus sp.]|uniref:DUF1134 domain-containing protein n=1 Tax=Acuticoccus sp. TaxID=1904378 RepID=UPI003B51B693